MSAATAGPRPRRVATPVLWAALAVGAAVLGGLAAAGASRSPTGAPALDGMAVRAAMDAAGTACVGLGLVSLLVPRSARGFEVRVHADRALVAVAGAWLGIVLVAGAVRAAEALGRPASELSGSDLRLWATQLAAGRGTVLAAGCVVVVLTCAVIRLRDPERIPARVPLVAALLGVITPAVTGHTTGSADHQLAVMAIAPHVGGAALWVGGLGAILVLVRRRVLLDAVLPRFSRLAAGCLVTVAGTGVVSAVLSLGSVTDLVTTGYGRLVVAKVAALLLLAGLGGVARRRLTRNAVPVLRWAGLEVALMAMTIGLAAALAQSGG